jgi:hypothetical protein
VDADRTAQPAMGLVGALHGFIEQPEVLLCGFGSLLEAPVFTAGSVSVSSSAWSRQLAQEVHDLVCAAMELFPEDMAMALVGVRMMHTFSSSAALRPLLGERACRVVASSVSATLDDAAGPSLELVLEAGLLLELLSMDDPAHCFDAGAPQAAIKALASRSLASHPDVIPWAERVLENTALARRIPGGGDEGEVGGSSRMVRVHLYSRQAVAALGSYSCREGAPFLRCSPAWGEAMQSMVDPAFHHPVSSCAADDMPQTAPKVKVWVDWGVGGGEDGGGSRGADDGCLDNSAPLQYTLTLRQGGTELARREMVAGDVTSLSSVVAVGASTEDELPLIAELSWYGGSRHLHLPPLLLLLAPSDGVMVGGADLLSLPGPRTDLSPPHLDGELADLLKCPLRVLHRGFGVELELLTEIDRRSTTSPRQAAPPRQKLIEAKTAEVKAEVAARVEAGIARGAAQQTVASLLRCAEWTVGIDDHIVASPKPVAERVVDAALSGEAPAGEAIAKLRERALSLLQGEGGDILKTEFKSPAPPKELSFASGGATDLASFVHIVRSMEGGAAATPLAATGFSGTAVHVHVNVCGADAAGDCLSARAILRVWLAWVVYDGVTAMFARPWMWREPSCAPLYATGAESSARVGRAWDEPSAREALGPNHDAYDVPAFLSGVHQALNSPMFAQRGEEEQRRTLFDPDDSPSSGLSRYCSLNLHRVTTYGTLEFRRFHGTLDATSLVCWSYFCVAFVEAASTKFDERPLLDVGLAEGLAWLRAAQERATRSALLEMVGGHMPPAVAERLRVHRASVSM